MESTQFIQKIWLQIPNQLVAVYEPLANHSISLVKFIFRNGANCLPAYLLSVLRESAEEMNAEWPGKFQRNISYTLLWALMNASGESAVLFSCAKWSEIYYKKLTWQGRWISIFSPENVSINQTMDLKWWGLFHYQNNFL